MKQTNTYTNNPLLDNYHSSPTKAVLRRQLNKLNEHTDKCINDKNSREWRIFTIIFYKDIAVREFANECIRKTISDVWRDKQLCRFAIKKKCNEINRHLAQFDISLGRYLEHVGQQDQYDDLIEKAQSFVSSRYTAFYAAVLNLLCKNSCTNPHIMAKIICANLVIEVHNSQLKHDIETYVHECPPLEMFMGMYSQGLENAVNDLRRLIAKQLIDKDEEVDPNKDEATKKAANILIGYLGKDTGYFSDIWEKIIAPTANLKISEE